MRVAVVDADGVGRHLPAELARYGAETTRVRSDNPDVHLTGADPADVEHHGDVDATAAALRAAGVGFVVAGAESGVLLADQLSAALGTPGNGMSRPLARRDKYEMVQAVRAAGLPVAASFAASDAERVADWARRLGRWPVVLKPLASAGSDSLRICHSVDEVRAGHAAIMASTNRYGARNETVLAQEYLHGDEFFVNTVSRDGVHHLVEVWRYHKRTLADGRWMFDYEHPVPLTDPHVTDLVDYALAVLDALEIRNGAGHTEVMLTAAGPVLVECGARLGGAHSPDVVSRCVGTNQVECLALAIARPADVVQRRLPTYQPRSTLRYVTLISPGDGVVPGPAGCARVRELPSFVDLVFTSPPGHPVTRTVDMATSVGYAYLESDDPEQVETDYKRLRELELDGLYGQGRHMTKAITELSELADIPADWVHQEKSIYPGEDLRLAGAYLKWYDIRAADEPATPEITEAARQYLRVEAAAGRLELKGDLGYAMLHVDGGYYLIVGLWRKDELWTGIFFRDTDGFKPYVIKPGAFRPTQNVVELDTTAHERRAWARFLRSARDEAAKRAYIEDYCTGIVGVP